MMKLDEMDLDQLLITLAAKVRKEERGEGSVEGIDRVVDEIRGRFQRVEEENEQMRELLIQIKSGMVNSDLPFAKHYVWKIDTLLAELEQSEDSS